MLKSTYITLIIWWVIFGIVHSGFASGKASRLATGVMGTASKYYRAVCSVIVLVTLLILIHYHFAAIDTILFRPHWIEKIIAGILILAGVAVMVVYIWSYLISFSGLGIIFGIEEDPGVRQTGLYGYVRHPMFAGAILFMWGVFLGYPYMNNLVSAFCLTFYAFIGIYFTEKKLAAVYGDAYRQYQQKVPVLLPFAIFK